MRTSASLTVKTLQNRCRAELNYSIGSEALKNHLRAIGIEVSSLASPLTEEELNAGFEYILKQETKGDMAILNGDSENINEDIQPHNPTGKEIILSAQQKEAEIKRVANQMQIAVLAEDVKNVALETNNVFLDRQQMLKEISTQLRKYVAYMVEKDNDILRTTTTELSQDMSRSNQAVVNLVNAFKEEVGASNQDLKRAVNDFASILAIPENR